MENSHFYRRDLYKGAHENHDPFAQHLNYVESVAVKIPLPCEVFCIFKVNARPIFSYVSSWNPTVAAELCIPHFLEEIHRPTMVAPVGPDKDDPASAANVNIQKQHIVGISGMCSCFPCHFVFSMLSFTSLLDWGTHFQVNLTVMT